MFKMYMTQTSLFVKLLIDAVKHLLDSTNTKILESQCYLNMV